MSYKVVKICWKKKRVKNNPPLFVVCNYEYDRQLQTTDSVSLTNTKYFKFNRKTPQ